MVLTGALKSSLSGELSSESLSSNRLFDDLGAVFAGNGVGFFVENISLSSSSPASSSTNSDGLVFTSSLGLITVGGGGGGGVVVGSSAGLDSGLLALAFAAKRIDSSLAKSSGCLLAGFSIGAGSFSSSSPNIDSGSLLFSFPSSFDLS